MFVAVILFAVSSGASSLPTSVPTNEDPCAESRWQLTGANAQVGKDVDAIWQPAWQPTLETIAACAKQARNAFACLEVQGQFDEAHFSKTVTDAFGGSEGVQNIRAQSRASKIVSVLYQLGVGATHLREVPPPSGPTYRGVAITLVSECLAQPPPPLVVAPASLPASQPVAVAPVPKVRRTNRVWLGAGLNLSLWVDKPDNTFAAVVQGAGGWNDKWLYARAALGVSFGFTNEQHVGGEFLLAFGARPLPWLEVGLAATMRWSTYALGVPWLEQSWSLGLDSGQMIYRIDDLTSLWVHELIAPVGQRMRRGEVDGGDVVQVPAANYWLYRFDVGLWLRRDLW